MRNLIIRGSIDHNARTVTLVRGDETSFVVPFSAFSVNGRGVEPDFSLEPTRSTDTFTVTYTVPVYQQPAKPSLDFAVLLPRPPTRWCPSCDKEITGLAVDGFCSDRCTADWKRTR
jgi:hypothetical protein